MDDPPSIVSSWKDCFVGAFGEESSMRGARRFCVFQDQGGLA